MAYLDLNGIAKEIERFVEDQIREQLARIPKIRGISRISTFDADGSVKRWRKPTAVDVGKLVRVSQDPVGDPRVLQLGTLEWAGDGGFDHPFSVRVNNESYVKAYRYAWIEVEARQEAPREPAPAAASDTIEAHGWLWRKATENDVGKEAYFCFFNGVNEPGMPPDELKLKIAGYSEGYFIPSAYNGWKARLAWIPVKQLESEPESEPEAISITPEPEHPEPVEVIKAPASDPNLTIYLHQGKAYRLANSSDIGKHVLVSDDALTHAVTEEAEMLLEIFEDAPLPYETTSAYWKLAFIEDPSLILDEPARGGEIKTDEQLQVEALPGLPPGAKLWLPGHEIAEPAPKSWSLAQHQEINASEMVCEVVPAADGSTKDPELPPLPEVEAEDAEDPSILEEYRPPAKRYRLLEAHEVIQEGDYINTRDNSSQSVSPLAPGFIRVKPSFFGRTPTQEPLFNFAREITSEQETAEAVEPEWTEPGPEHVGQMVEVRRFQGGEPWKERQLLAILPETQDSRYICRSSAISSHQNWWVYARVRKAQQ